MKLSCLEWILLILILTFMVGPLVMLGAGVLYLLLPKDKTTTD